MLREERERGVLSSFSGPCEGRQTGHCCSGSQPCPHPSALAIATLPLLFHDFSSSRTMSLEGGAGRTGKCRWVLREKCPGGTHPPGCPLHQRPGP